MLVDNKNFREAEHIGDDMLNQADLAMDSKCRSVERTLADGVFTLEKALKLYKVPKETYLTFVAKKHAAKIDTEVNTESVKDRYFSTINIFEKMIYISFSSVIDISAFEKVFADFRKVSAEVENGNILLKEKVTLK